MAKDGEASLLLKIKEVGSEALNKTSNALKEIAKGAAIVATAVIGFGTKAIAAYGKQEESVNSLNQSLKNQGIYSAELSKEYQTMASELQKVTKYGDEETIAAQAKLQAYLGETKITKELTKSVMDFAAAQGVDLKTAADLVGKTVGSSTNALTRYGIEIDTSGTKSDKLASVIDGLNSKFGGQAEAQAQGLGSLTQLNNAFGDFMEVVGKGIAPLVVLVTQKLTEFVTSVQENKSAMDRMNSIFQGTAIGLAVLKAGFTAVGQVIGTVLGGTVEAISALIEGRFVDAAKAAGQIVTLSFEDIKNTAQTLDDDIALVEQAFDERQSERRAAELENIVVHNEAKSLIQEEADLAAEEKRLAKEAADNLAEQKKATIEFQWQMKRINQEIAFAKTKEQLEAAHLKKMDLMHKAQDLSDANRQKLTKEQELSLDQATAQAKVNIMTSSARLITAVMGRESKIAFLAQKTAALASAIVATNVASAQALAVPPAPNLALAGLAQIAGGINIAAILAESVTGLAEGGIVMPTPGGTIARIGEGGQPEAVIPLDKMGGGMGGTINIIVNGGLLGDEESARRLAVALDYELLKLRRSSESVAFDTGVV